MPNLTRQEVIAAHEALEELDDTARNLAKDQDDKDLCELWKKRILAALPPRPQPTMDDVEWDDDKHCLAEAEHPNFGKVIMLRLNAHNLIEFIAPECHASRFKDTSPGNLTPTGRRYTFTEVQE